MLAKMGRPKAENPRNIKFSLRMNEKENEMLEIICEITGKNKNEVIREAIERYYNHLEKK